MQFFNVHEIQSVTLTEKFNDECIRENEISSRIEEA